VCVNLAAAVPQRTRTACSVRRVCPMILGRAWSAALAATTAHA
jgi:hypothetical protein